MIFAKERIRTGVLAVQTWKPESARGDAFRYVDISSVDRESKSITSVTHLAVDDAPSRARQLLKVNDILVSTVRPNLNAVAIVPLELDGSVGSTGFTVLRANPERLLPQYLFHWVRTPMFVADMVKKATGASYPAINDRIVLDSELPVLSLPEQRRIAALLDKADGIRRKRREAIALAESFLRSAFLEMFGDPVGNPRGWEQRSLSEVADIASGVTKGRNFGPMPTIQVPYMRVANVQDGRLDLREVKSVEILPRELERFRLLDGDVLVTEGGDPDKLGRGAVWRGQVQDCIHQNHIFRIRPDIGLLLPEYLSAQLGSSRGKRYFMRAAKQTTGIASINMSQLKAFPVLVPPVALQSKFAKVCDAADKMVDRQRAVLAETERLFEALVGDVFGGYL